MIHSEIMFLEILRLYSEVCEGEALSLKRLEEAFYACQDLITERLYISSEYDFETEFGKLEDLCDEQIQFDQDDLLIVDEAMIDLLEDDILAFLGEDIDGSLDSALSDIIHQYSVYHALGIKPPIEDYQDLFNLSMTIIRDYQLLAKQEATTGQINPYLFQLIKVFKEKYLEVYSEYSFCDISKLEAVITYLNEIYLLDGEQDFLNSDWYIILFGQDENQKNALFYSRIMNSISEESEEYEDVEDEEEVETSNLPSEVTYIDSEIDFFLCYFIILLHQYLKQSPDIFIKESLNIKKYLLITIIPSMEDYFLETRSLDDFTFENFNRNLLTNSSFSSLFLIVMESIDAFNLIDLELNRKLKEEIIIKALFIRSFLDLSINEEHLSQVKNKILYSKFYKNENNQFATSIVDDIIFRENGLDLIRNKF